MTVPCAKVSDLAEQIRGVSYGKQDALSIPKTGYLPVLRANNITDNGLIFDDLVYVPAQRVSNKQRVQQYDIVIAASSGSLDVVGKAAPVLSNFEGGFGAFCKVLRPNSKVNPSYFAHFFKTQHYRQRVSALAEGANINNLRNEHLDNFEIPLPPIAEQKRIAAILDKAEELRSLRRKALGELDAIVQSIFLEMFGDPSTNSMKWKKGCLGDISTFIGGGTPKRECPEYFKGSICWATSKDMKHEFLDDTQEHITPEAINKSATNLVPVNTILIVVKSKILMHSLPVAITRVPTCFGQDIKGIRILESCDVTFVATALRYGKRWLLERARGINTEGLTLDHLKAFPLLIPPIELQQEFARRVEAIEQLKTTHRESIAQLDALFASLQHRAFRGEL